MIPIFSSSSTVHASDDPKSMADVAAHYAPYGVTYAGDKTNYKLLDKVGNDWNYFGYGSESLLGNGARGTRTATYEALKSELYSASDNSLEIAARFANAMSQAGLDHIYQGSIPYSTRWARLAGAIGVLLLLAVVTIADGLLNVAYKLFKWINPFFVMQYLVTKNGTKGAQTSSLWSPVMSVARPLYHSLGNIAFNFAILAFLIGLLFALTGHAFLKQESGAVKIVQDRRGKAFVDAIWKMLRRVFVFFAAPILIGALSNDLLNDIKSSTDFTAPVYEQIYGNYVDFGNWAQHSRLAFPSASGSSSNNNRLTPQGDNTVFTPKYVNKINAFGAGLPIAQDISNKGSNKMSASKKYAQTVGFLFGRYVAGGTYNGTDWESYVSAKFRQGYAKAGDDGGVKNPMDYFKYQPNSKVGTDFNKNDTHNNYKNYDMDDGNKTQVNKNPLLSDYSLSYDKKSNSYSTNAPSTTPAQLGSSKNAGLSTLGLYNYLNVMPTGSGVTYTKPSSFLGVSLINQHAAVGCVGRGMYFLANYFLMLTFMFETAIILVFAAFVVIQSAIAGIPRFFLYVLELGTLRWEGFIGVLKELINIYGRLLIAMLIVGIFNDTVMTIFDKIEDMLTGPHGIFQTVMLSNSWLPFQTNIFALAIIKFILCFTLYALGIAFIKFFADALHFVNHQADKLLRAFGGTGHATPAMPNMPNGKFGGNMNGSGNGMNGMNGSDGNGSDGNDGSDPNSADSVRARIKDRNSQFDAQNPSMKDSVKQNAALLGLDTMDKLEKSPLGKLATKGAEAAMAHIGGAHKGLAGKLKNMMNLQGRGDGVERVQKGLKHLHQSMANLADPTTADNSASATMSKHDKENEEVSKQGARDQASDNAIKDAEKAEEQAQEKQDQKNQAYNDLPNQIDSQGQIKDADKADEVMQNTYDALDQLKGNDAKEAKDKMADTLSKYQDMAKEQVAGDDYNKKVAQAQQDVDNDQKQVQQDEQQAQKDQQNVDDLAERAQTGDTDAQQQLPDAQDQLKKSKAKLGKSKAKLDKDQQKLKDLKDNKAKFDPATRALLTNATGQNVGNHGEKMHKLNDKMRQRARNAQFTALTGKKASMTDQNGQSTLATPEMMQQAQQASDDAIDTLTSRTASNAEKESARKALQDANVVLTTGYQYGQFSQNGQTPAYQNANKEDIERAKAHQDKSYAAARTGYFVKTDKTGKSQASPAAMKVAQEYAQANRILTTGMIDDQHQASAEDIEKAQNLVNSSPEQRVQRVQAQMINTSTQVMNDARTYASQHVSGENAQERATSYRENLIEYLEQPKVQSQLQSVGMVQTNSSPKQITEQINRVISIDRQAKAAMNASLAPIRREVYAGGFDRGNSTAITPEVRENIIRTSAAEQTNQLPANSEWVDRAHFGTTTYGQVKQQVTKIIEANRTGDVNKISRAKIEARNAGMANALINDVTKCQNILTSINSTQDTITNNALSKQATSHATFND